MENTKCRTAVRLALSTTIMNHTPVNSATMNEPAYVPSTKAFVDSLLTELAGFRLPATSTDPRGQTAIQDQPLQNPFARLPVSGLSKVKPLMLTLHCLFPNDLLPALDILDCGLVRRFVHADDGDTASTAPGHGQTAVREDQCTLHPDIYITSPTEDIFLVTSASTVHLSPAAPASISTTYSQAKAYEVRLHAWNCTCPTFALSAFRNLTTRLDTTERHTHAEQLQDLGPVVYPFGGTLTCSTDRASPPICKHILACVLFARCPGLFGGEGNGKCVVSMEELAGWCAGWGG